MKENIGWTVGMIFFSLCLALQLFAIIKPQIFVKLDLLYYGWVLRWLGYEVEFRPISPGKPEKIARSWAIVGALFFIVLLVSIGTGIIETKN